MGLHNETCRERSIETKAAQRASPLGYREPIGAARSSCIVYLLHILHKAHWGKRVVDNNQQTTLKVYRCEDSKKLRRKVRMLWWALGVTLCLLGIALFLTTIAVLILLRYTAS